MTTAAWRSGGGCCPGRRNRRKWTTALLATGSLHIWMRSRRSSRSISRADVRAVVDRLFDGWQQRRTTYIIGNGGSASTASHMMNDLNKMTTHSRVSPAFGRSRSPTTCRTLLRSATISSTPTFSVEQLRNLLRPNDVLIAISGSGNSENVIRAAQLCATDRCRRSRALRKRRQPACANAPTHCDRTGEKHLPARRRASHSQSRDRSRLPR